MNIHKKLENKQTLQVIFEKSATEPCIKLHKFLILLNFQHFVMST